MTCSKNLKHAYSTKYAYLSQFDLEAVFIHYYFWGFFQSQTMIKTEEDAAMALQVSNALTQALLQYRLKNVPKEVCIFNTNFTISKKSGKEEYIHFKIKLHVTTNLVLYN